MSDIIKIADKITKRAEALETIRQGRQLSEAVKQRSSAIANYEKAMAITLIKLKNGVEFELEGEKISSPQATIMEKIAKGICFEEKLAMEEAECMYKALLASIEMLKAELNGYQSVYKHLD